MPRAEAPFLVQETSNSNFDSKETSVMTTFFRPVRQGPFNRPATPGYSLNATIPQSPLLPGVRPTTTKRLFRSRPAGLGAFALKPTL